MEEINRKTEANNRGTNAKFTPLDNSISNGAGAKQTRIRRRIFSVGFAFLFCVALALPAAAQDANLYFSPSSGSFDINQSFWVSVYVSSADQAINAVSGTISFPQDKLEVVSLSKTGTIFNLWIQEPNFSNDTGVINFEGIVLNPGFTGSTGKIINVSFKTKSAGSATLSFSSGAVLANDGKGTNILAGVSSANFTVSLREITPPPAGTPPAPEISSPTHPDPEKWYSNNNPEFNWKLPQDVIGVSFLFHQKPIADPGPISDGLMESKKFKDVEDGIWYFHIKFQNRKGWGEISHYKIQIDTKPPLPFGIEVKEGEEATNPQPTLIFEAIDETSGIDYYEVKIDQGDPIKIKEKEYKLPIQSLGKHTIIIKAVDWAGNYTLAMTEINIVPIEAPVITDYPKTLLPGSILSIKGKAILETQIKIYYQIDEKEIEIGETKSDKDGNWNFVATKPLEKGIYKIWAVAIDSSGAKSGPSEKVTVQVTPPAFIRIGKLVIDYLTTIITLFVLILILVLGIIWSWRKIIQRRKRLKKEITETEKALYRAFKALKEEIEEQVAKLDGKPGLSEREKKICNNLKEALKISEKFIGKEIEDIEKELK